MAIYTGMPKPNSFGDKASAIVHQEKLAAFKHFPKPIFLFNRELELLETNDQGEVAIENFWVGVRGNKLHFNSPDNNAYVAKVINALYSKKSSKQLGKGARSERFILRNIDSVCRSYTISRESEHNDNLIMEIQGDIGCTESKIQCLARAFSLTNSESRIIKLMVTGLKPKEIAYEAGISLNTVRSHLRTLYAKLHVNSYNDALVYATRLLV